MLRKGSHTPFLRRGWRKWKSWVSFKAAKSDIGLGKVCYLRSQILQPVSLLCSLTLNVKIQQETLQNQSSESLDLFQAWFHDVNPIPWFKNLTLSPGAFPEHSQSSGPPKSQPPAALSVGHRAGQTRLLVPELMRGLDSKIALLKVTSEICNRARSRG